VGWWATAGVSRHPDRQGYAAAIGELAQLNAKVLSAAARLKSVTIEALLAKSDLEVGIEAVAIDWAGPGVEA
jgi:hypothetical protein